MNGGSSVRVLCTIINGDQPIEITWLKDGKKLSEYRRKTQKLDENTVILSLRKLQLEDSGNYTCVAQNPAGSTSHWGILKIKGTYLPKVSIFPFLFSFGIFFFFIRSPFKSFVFITVFPRKLKLP